jgi:hypothetical protein
MAADAVGHLEGPTGKIVGVDQFIAFQEGLLAALPDIQTGSRNACHLAQRRSGLIGCVSRLPAID